MFAIFDVVLRRPVMVKNFSHADLPFREFYHMSLSIFSI
jgi:hypothetical protein